jgi:hypothetical protein
VSVPVFVTSFGRYEMLMRCLTSLDRFFDDITTVDNTANGNRFREQAPWALGLVPHDRPYIVCDEDIEIDPSCPDDLFGRLLDASFEFYKVGLQIRTDDVPEVERYAHSLEWERSLNARRAVNGIIPAEVDTHFAMYRGKINPGICGVRLAAPYQCRHQPWYNEEFTDEEIDYYRRTGPEWARTHSAGELCES